jgi:hypothetical protein
LKLLARNLITGAEIRLKLRTKIEEIRHRNLAAVFDEIYIYLNQCFSDGGKTVS